MFEIYQLVNILYWKKNPFIEQNAIQWNHLERKPLNKREILNSSTGPPNGQNSFHFIARPTSWIFLEAYAGCTLDSDAGDEAQWCNDHLRAMDHGVKYGDCRCFFESHGQILVLRTPSKRLRVTSNLRIADGYFRKVCNRQCRFRHHGRCEHFIFDKSQTIQKAINGRNKQ